MTTDEDARPLRTTITRGIWLAAALLAVLYLAWQLQWAVALIFLAIVVAVFFRTGGDLMTRIVGRRHRHLGLAAFCVLLVLATAGLFLTAVPLLVGQSDELVTGWKQAGGQAEAFLQERAWGQYVLDQLDATDLNEVAGGRAMSLLGRGTSAGIAAIFLLFTGLYLAAEPDMHRRGVLWLTPPRLRSRANKALLAAGEALQKWILGQVAAMATVGVLSGVGLFVLGVRLWLLHAVLAFLLCFIPNFGPVASVLPPALIALSMDGGRFLGSGPQLAAAVVVLYLGIQLVESYLTTPLIQRKAADLPPALLIATQLVLGLLLGLTGLATAAPLLAVLVVVLPILWIHGDVEHDSPMKAAPAGTSEGADGGVS